MSRLLIAALACLLGTAWVAAAPLHTPPDLTGAGWSVLTFSGKAPARFIGRAEGDLEIHTHGSTAILYRSVEPPAAGMPTLRWSWRVDRAVPATDLSKRGGDDRSLALHLWFPESPGHRPDPFTRIGRGLARAFGARIPGNTITYVWGGEHKPGTVLANPYFSDGVIVVVENSSAPLAAWRDAAVDWRADFKRAFGFGGPQPSVLGVSADSDDTQTRSLGFIRNIRFE